MIFKRAALFILTFLALTSAHASDRADKLNHAQFKQSMTELVIQSATTKDGKLHLETVLSTIGALSGYALQQGIREFLIKKRGATEADLFLRVQGGNNRVYYFGKIFDKPLYDSREGQVSVWSILVSAAQQAGERKLPDLNALVDANVAKVGSDDYGTSDVAPPHQPMLSHFGSLANTWPSAQKILHAYGSHPMHWGWDIAVIAQDIMIKNKDNIAPYLAVQLVMEGAISMSKVKALPN